MSDKVARPAVSEVFTPRRTEVNTEIYIERPDLEKALRRAIEGSKHVVVHGESGSGKSWLYKKVLADLGATTVTANAANAARRGSIARDIFEAAVGSGHLQLKEQEQGGKAGIKIPFAEAGVEAKRIYEVVKPDELLQAFQSLREKATTAPAVVVIDNLELIVGNETLMSELASIITLLDDERYAATRVKILLVGVPSVLREYFSKTPAAATISNRLTEVPEIAGLEKAQVDELVLKGFVNLLKIEITDEALVAWQDHVSRVTMGYAQAVQEYCEQLGYVVEDDDWYGAAEDLALADTNWLHVCQSHASVTVTSRMNERRTKEGRRNQVLYALGLVQSRVITVPEVEEIVRREFPESTSGVGLAIGQLLSELATNEGSGDAILKAAPGVAGSYVFKHAAYAMALRVMLMKELEGEKVITVQTSAR